MPTYVAFLRGINVGGHRVKMPRLAELFTELGFANVSTYIASGNVIFDSDETNEKALCKKIENRLSSGLGFEVPTLLRTTDELNQVLADQPFPPEELETKGHSVLITFLPSAPPASVNKALRPHWTERDEFLVVGREWYWLSRGRMTDTLADMRAVGRILSEPGTMRNLRTVEKIVAKYG